MNLVGDLLAVHCNLDRGRALWFRIWIEGCYRSSSVISFILPLVGVSLIHQFVFVRIGSGDACRKLLAADGLTLQQMDAAKEIGIKLQGSLRPLVVRPEDLSWACSEEFTDSTAAKLQPPIEEAYQPATTMEDGQIGDIGGDDVVVSFKLPPGSYALEAMRELMKQPQ